MDPWEDEGWSLGASNFFVFQFHDSLSPIFSDIDDDWTSDSTLEDNFAMSTRAPHLEVIACIDMIIIIVRLQFTQKLTHFFPAKVTAIAILYGELDLLDHTFSFLWKAAPRPTPRSPRPYHPTTSARSEALQRSSLYS